MGSDTPSGSSFWNQIEQWVYDEHNNVTSYSFDEDGDGSWEFTREITWLNDEQWETIEDNHYTGGVITAAYLSNMYYSTDGFSDYIEVSGTDSYVIDHRWYCAE